MLIRVVFLICYVTLSEVCHLLELLRRQLTWVDDEVLNNVGYTISDA